MQHYTNHHELEAILTLLLALLATLLLLMLLAQPVIA